MSMEDALLRGLREAKLDPAAVLEHSFKNFHTKGFDYLCLKRSAKVTLKVYFFDGNLAQLPEVVVPHDHRYDFKSMVLAGEVAERRFARTFAPPDGAGTPYEEFEYRTPLNGGDGFTWKREAYLRQTSERAYQPGESYDTHASALHTLNIKAPESILFLAQFADLLPVDEPTAAFRPAGQRDPINLDGLYEKPDLSYVRSLMDRTHKALARLQT